MVLCDVALAEKRLDNGFDAWRPIYLESRVNLLTMKNCHAIVNVRILMIIINYSFMFGNNNKANKFIYMVQ